MAKLAIDAPSLTALVNHAFDYKGAALSNLRITFEDGHLVQHGTLKKGISCPLLNRCVCFGDTGWPAAMSTP